VAYGGSFIRRLKSTYAAVSRQATRIASTVNVYLHQSCMHQLLYIRNLKLIIYRIRSLLYEHISPITAADGLRHPAESEFRRPLRSASSHELSVPRNRLSTYGDRAFPVAAVQIWNSLPQHITSAPPLPVFCSRLKTYFFELCYP